MRGPAARFPAGPEGAQKLNNLVTELLRVAGPDESSAARTFVNPRTGFVYVSNRGSNTASSRPRGPRKLRLALSQDYGDTYETLSPAERPLHDHHTRTKELIVRAIAQTVHDYANTKGIYVTAFGPYAGEFEERHVFPHTNTFLVQDADIEHDFAKNRRPRGGDAGARGNGGYAARRPVTARCGHDMLATGLGFSHPRYRRLPGRRVRRIE